MSRVSWDEYFMGIARQVATRATCDRKHVGSVIVRNRAILATGYNGSVRGEAHCDDVGHLLVNDSCQRVVHSEMNAIAHAARLGVRVGGAWLYVTASPCWPCFRLLANAGITRIVYGEKFYRDNELIHEVAERMKMEMSFLPLEPIERPVVVLRDGATARMGSDGVVRRLELAKTEPEKPPGCPHTEGARTEGGCCLLCGEYV